MWSVVGYAHECKNVCTGRVRVSRVYSCTLIYEYGGVEVQCVSNLISQ